MPPAPHTPSANSAATLLAEGRLDEALTSGNAELAEARREAEDDKTALPTLVNALEILAEVHRQTGGFEKSESLYQEALDTTEKCEVPVEQRARLRSGLA